MKPYGWKTNSFTTYPEAVIDVETSHLKGCKTSLGKLSGSRCMLGPKVMVTY